MFTDKVELKDFEKQDPEYQDLTTPRTWRFKPIARSAARIFM